MKAREQRRAHDHHVKKGARLTGDDRTRMTKTVTSLYREGKSIRDISAATGRSYGFVHRVLSRERSRAARTRRRDPATDGLTERPGTTGGLPGGRTRAAG